MTVITRVPGTADTGLPQVIPDLGMTLTHLWLPANISGGVWRDEVGGLALTATGGGTPTLQSEGLVPYLHCDGSFYLNDAGVTLPAADLRTIVLVARPETGDVESAASNGGIVSSTAVAIRQGVASTQVGTTPTTTPSVLTASLDNWHMYAMRLPSGAAGNIVVDGTAGTLGAAADLDRVRLLRSSSGAYREMKLAFAATSSDTVSAAHLTGVVYPRLKAWLNPLDWA